MVAPFCTMRPAAHEPHGWSPAFALNVAGRHCVQVPEPEFLNCPAMHIGRQTSALPEELVVCVADGHEHEILLLSATACVGHAVHGPVPVPVLIKSPEHDVHCIAPLSNSCPSGHAVITGDGEGDGAGAGAPPPTAVV